MKALVLTGARQIELRDLPVPRPGPGQVLIRHIATAISTGSEVIRYIRGAGPDIGYLGAGIVEAIGEGVTELQPGDRVRDGGPHHEYVVQPARIGQDRRQIGLDLGLKLDRGHFEVAR